MAQANRCNQTAFVLCVNRSRQPPARQPPLKCQPVDDPGEQFASDSAIHHPVRQFSDLSENRSKSARVRAICNHAWTRRTPSAARIRRIQQNLSGRDLARSMNHRRKFAGSWNTANRPDEGRRVRRTPWLRPRIMSTTRHGSHRLASNRSRYA